MSRVKVIAATLLVGSALLVPRLALADAFVVSSTISTNGSFQCIPSLACSGEGTNSLTIQSGSERAVLSFVGVSKTIDISARSSLVNLGTFQFEATDGFVFPTHPTSRHPILGFSFHLSQQTPVAGTISRSWGFGPGGGSALPLQKGSVIWELPLGPNPYNYSGIIYTLHPFPIALRPNSSTQLTANAGVVPEPASLLLLGSGLAGAIAARRRRRAKPATKKSR